MVAETNWDSFIGQDFTGRQREMDILARELLNDEAKAVAIVGSVGMGKTRLAMMFGHKYRAFFSAGVYHMRSTPFESLNNTVAAHVSNPTAPYLLVLDDVENRPPFDLPAEIQALRRGRPSARIICTSRHTVAVPVDVTLQLAGFNEMEFFELLSKTGTFERDSEAARELFHSVSGNVLATRLISDLLRSGQMSPRQILLSLKDFSASGILDSSGNPIIAGAPADKQIIADVRTVSDQL